MIGLQKIEPGKNTELRVFNSFIQWRVVGETTWKNLVSLSEIQGPSGVAGTFTQLSDVPNSYSGQSRKGVRVNQSANGLEFYSLLREDSWFFPIGALNENSPFLEGSTFPKTYTLPALLRETTINRLSGLINSQSSGTAIISIQFGLNSWTNITGLSTLACTTSVLADQLASVNNVIPAGQRLRISFASITGTLNLSFRLDVTEAL